MQRDQEPSVPRRSDRRICGSAATPVIVPLNNVRSLARRSCASPPDAAAAKPPSSSRNLARRSSSLTPADWSLFQVPVSISLELLAMRANSARNSLTPPASPSAPAASSRSFVSPAAAEAQSSSAEHADSASVPPPSVPPVQSAPPTPLAPALSSERSPPVHVASPPPPPPPQGAASPSQQGTPSQKRGRDEGDDALLSCAFVLPRESVPLSDDGHLSRSESGSGYSIGLPSSKSAQAGPDLADAAAVPQGPAAVPPCPAAVPPGPTGVPPGPADVLPNASPSRNPFESLDVSECGQQNHARPSDVGCPLTAGPSLPFTEAEEPLQPCSSPQHATAAQMSPQRQSEGDVPAASTPGDPFDGCRPDAGDATAGCRVHLSDQDLATPGAAARHHHQPVPPASFFGSEGAAKANEARGEEQPVGAAESQPDVSLFIAQHDSHPDDHAAAGASTSSSNPSSQAPSAQQHTPCAEGATAGINHDGQLPAAPCCPAVAEGAATACQEVPCLPSDAGHSNAATASEPAGPAGAGLQHVAYATAGTGQQQPAHTDVQSGPQDGFEATDLQRPAQQRGTCQPAAHTSPADATAGADCAAAHAPADAEPAGGLSDATAGADCAAAHAPADAEPAGGLSDATAGADCAAAHAPADADPAGGLSDAQRAGLRAGPGPIASRRSSSWQELWQSFVPPFLHQPGSTAVKDAAHHAWPAQQPEPRSLPLAASHGVPPASVGDGGTGPGQPRRPPTCPAREPPANTDADIAAGAPVDASPRGSPGGTRNTHGGPGRTGITARRSSPLAAAGEQGFSGSQQSQPWQQLQPSQQALQRQNAALLAELTALRVKRDGWAAERDSWLDKEASWHAQRDELYRERDAWRADLERLRDKVRHLRDERQDLRAAVEENRGAAARQLREAVTAMEAHQQAAKAADQRAVGLNRRVGETLQEVGRLGQLNRKFEEALRQAGVARPAPRQFTEGQAAPAPAAARQQQQQQQQQPAGYPGQPSAQQQQQQTRGPKRPYEPLRHQQRQQQQQRTEGVPPSDDETQQPQRPDPAAASPPQPQPQQPPPQPQQQQQQHPLARNPYFSVYRRYNAPPPASFSVPRASFSVPPVASRPTPTPRVFVNVNFSSAYRTTGTGDSPPTPKRPRASFATSRPAHNVPPTAGASGAANDGGSSGGVPPAAASAAAGAAAPAAAPMAVWDVQAEVPTLDENTSVRVLKDYLGQAGLSTRAAICTEKAELLELARGCVNAWEIRRILACADLGEPMRHAAVFRSNVAPPPVPPANVPAPPAVLRPELQTAYRALVLRVHPDKNRGDPLATSAFQQLQTSYNRMAGIRNSGAAV